MARKTRSIGGAFRAQHIIKKGMIGMFNLQGRHSLAEDPLNIFACLQVGDSLSFSPLGPEGPRVKCEIHRMDDFGYCRVFYSDFRDESSGYYTLKFEVYPEAQSKNSCVILGSPEPITPRRKERP